MVIVDWLGFVEITKDGVCIIITKCIRIIK